MAYPSTLDNLPTNHVDNVSEPILAATINDIARADNAIEAELGTNPKGGFADVKSRIAAAEASASAAAAAAAGAIPKSLLGFAGDMIYSTAAGILARLGVGSAGAALSSDGTKPVWATSLDAIARSAISEGGVTRGARRTIDFVEGGGILIDLQDDPANESVHVTLTGTAGGGGGGDTTIVANTQTGDYTTVLSDAGKVIEMNAATPKTITIPPNASVAYPVGTVIELFRLGSGEVTISPGAGVTLRTVGGVNRLNKQYSSATLRQRATNEWVLAGDLKALSAAAYAGLNGIGVSNAGGATLTFTTTRGIQAGEHVCVAVGCSGGGGAATAVSVGALSLTRDVAAPTTYRVAEQWSARATADIASGSTITVTVPGTNKLAICFSLGSVAAASYLDVSATNEAASSSSPVSGTTAATALANSIAIGVCAWSHQSDPATPGGTYVEIGEINDGVGGSSLQAQYNLLPLTGAEQSAWTTSSPHSYCALVQVYKPA